MGLLGPGVWPATGSVRPMQRKRSCSSRRGQDAAVQNAVKTTTRSSAPSETLPMSLAHAFPPKYRLPEGPVAVLLMGLPGGGKTTVATERYSDLELIAPDLLKRPGTGEHDLDEHRRSVRASVDKFNDTLDTKKSLVLDSTGSNQAWLRDRVEEAKEAGYKVHVCYVDVPVEVALYRNRNRAATGGRWTPEHVILDKARVLPKSFAYIREHVDEAIHVRNYNDGIELRMAELDLYLYPAPRDRSGARPWQPEYGAPVGEVCPMNRSTRRCLRLGGWRRSKSCSRAKEKRMDELDAMAMTREEFIEKEVLCGREWMIEPNKFPYMLPDTLEHLTVWSNRNRTHEELVEWVENHLEKHRPDVVAWNYDQNAARRTIDTFHVHVYVCCDERVVHRLNMCDADALNRRDTGELPEGADKMMTADGYAKDQKPRRKSIFDGPASRSCRRGAGPRSPARAHLSAAAQSRARSSGAAQRSRWDARELPRSGARRPRPEPALSGGEAKRPRLER